MRRGLLALVLTACGGASPVGGTTESSETTAGQMMTGGATWQDVPTSTETTSSTSSGGSEVTSSSEDSTTSGSEDSTTSGSETSAETTSGPVDPGSSSSEDTAAVDCSELACGACAMCVVEESCAQVANMCTAIDGCETTATCLVSCGVSGLCLDDCCDGMSKQAIITAFQVDECVADACAAACPDYNEAVCN